MDFNKFLTEEEMNALEKECMKHLFIIDFLEKHGVLAEKMNVEIIASIRAQANQFLRNFQYKQNKEPQKDLFKVFVTDGERKTINEREYLKAIGFKFDNQRKGWYGEIDKNILEELGKKFTVTIEG
ncbi:MAG: hypothetical protein H5T45_01445 [Thermoplasmatales archaeon]|nr:hypothetical protein [Thermoplasmatales archaeon]